MVHPAEAAAAAACLAFQGLSGAGARQDRRRNRRRCRRAAKTRGAAGAEGDPGPARGRRVQRRCPAEGRSGQRRVAGDRGDRFPRPRRAPTRSATSPVTAASPPHGYTPSADRGRTLGCPPDSAEGSAPANWLCQPDPDPFQSATAKLTGSGPKYGSEPSNDEGPDAVTWRAPCGAAPGGGVGVTVVSPTPGRPHPRERSLRPGLRRASSSTRHRPGGTRTKMLVLYLGFTGCRSVSKPGCPAAPSTRSWPGSSASTVGLPAAGKTSPPGRWPTSAPVLQADRGRRGAGTHRPGSGTTSVTALGLRPRPADGLA